MVKTAVLQTAYFGPIQWYQKLHRYDRTIIEQHDSYQKQTYRNRCIIATANGLQALTVPVERLADGHEASATTTSGAAHTGMPFRAPIARVHSLNIMPMISAHSMSGESTIL